VLDKEQKGISYIQSDQRERIKMKDLLAKARERNSGKIMDSKRDEYSLPTLEELFSLMEAEEASLEKAETTNAYSVYMVYSSGPCIGKK